jgi:hypothetical protein
MRRFLLAVAALVPAALLLLPVVATTARADATIEASTYTINYPNEIVFSLRATAGAAITDVALVYTLKNRNIRSVGKPSEFTPGTTVDTRVSVTTNPNTTWIPVGNEFTWWWEITLADGSVTKSPENTFVYLPPNRDWKTVTNDFAAVYYFGPRDDLARRMLVAMEDVYERVGKGLFQTELEQLPVKLVVIGDSNDMRMARPSSGQAFDNSLVVTCGLRPGGVRDIIYAAVSCGDAVDTVRHEFGHILNGAAGHGTLVDFPFWLEEGLAVYAQEDPSNFVAAFRAATQPGRGRGLLPFSRMTQATSNPNETILQYGQAFMMTSYLIDTYGVEKLRELMALTKRDTRFDRALQEVYGFDLAGFEAKFREAMGAGSGPAATPTSPQQPAQPTARPTSQAQPQQPTPAPTIRQQPAPSDGGGGGGGGLDTSTLLIFGTAFLLLLMAVFAFLVLLYFQNMRRGGPAA